MTRLEAMAGGIPVDWVEVATDWDQGRREGEANQRFAEREVTHGMASKLRPGDPAWENVVGAVAVHAFGDHYGFAVQRFFSETPGGDGGQDAQTPLGRVDVKGSNRKPYFLGVSAKGLQGPRRADYYVLVYCPEECPSAWIAGWVTRVEILAAAPRPNAFPVDANPRAFLKPGL